jgi:hypothetical protein
MSTPLKRPDWLFEPQVLTPPTPKYVKVEIKPPVNSIEKAQKKKIIMVPVDGISGEVPPDPLFA